MSLNKVIDAVEEEMENDMAGLQVEEEIETDGDGIITFDLDHIITDLRLHVPIDQFSINIRSEVRRTFIDKFYFFLKLANHIIITIL